MKVLFIDNQGGGFADYLEISQGTTVEQFFSDKMAGRKPNDYLITIHEYAHAWMACRYGDDTAKRMGRLTLNPFVHISLIGTIILPLLVHFGWAKPVPVNFSVLTRKQIFWVAVAGPLTNILQGLILTGIFYLFRLEAVTALGNYVLLAILFNLILAVVNLLPIPPLDGSKMAYALLKSPGAISAYKNYAQYGMYVFVAFLLLGGFRAVVLPVAELFYALLGLPLPILTIKQLGEKGTE